MGAETGKEKEDMTGIEIDMMVDIETEEIGEVVAEKGVKEEGTRIVTSYCS